MCIISSFVAKCGQSEQLIKLLLPYELFYNTISCQFLCTANILHTLNKCWRCLFNIYTLGSGVFQESITEGATRKRNIDDAF